MLPFNLSLLVLALLTHEASAQRLKPTGVFRIPPPKASPHLALAADNPPTPVAAFTVPSSLPSCLPNSYSASNLNEIIAAKGPNFTLSLCPNTTYILETTLILTALGQEISTLGYPEGSERAMLVVDGNTNITNGMTTAISAINFDALKIRNIQIDGNRGSSGPYMGGANLELGGPARGQVVDRVRSFDPRGWSCLHIAEGQLNCADARITNNDIGPCGHDYPYGAWADGISLSCKDSLVENNDIIDPTDGGIVIFGSAGSRIANNRISVRNETALGGINLVDYEPWDGWYNGTVVENNQIFGGFADSYGNETHGGNEKQAIVKIGVGIGPRVWFGSGSAETLVAKGGPEGAYIRNNTFSGGLGWAVAVGNAEQFVVEGNSVHPNTSFIGHRSVNCTNGVEKQGNITINVPYLVQDNTTSSVRLQDDFTSGNVIFLPCLSAPSSDSHVWPYGSGPASVDYPSRPVVNAPKPSPATTSSSSSPSDPSSTSDQSSESASFLTIPQSSIPLGICCSFLLMLATFL